MRMEYNENDDLRRLGRGSKFIVVCAVGKSILMNSPL